ncbi:aspartate aminotransferase family protein [Fodinicurvata sediminis]|uniref:aspartate aminotransferase family protein n=1 Tax=Fodinicurvata sediminis TaxID=1121832 RepID=UPI0003B67E5F|nr:aspartate aminotransferase family protein [Fodinicurvata sediminis]
MSDALMNTYARADIAFERGEGPYLITREGDRYLDFASGIAVTSLGHAHPHLVKALQEQAAHFWHCSNLFRIPEGERLAERLVANSFADRVFFCNSGVEAFEAATKLVRKYFDDRNEPDRWQVITCNGAFHGRSLTAISAAGNEKYMAGFAPHVPGFTQVAFEDPDELRGAITDETAAILVEPIQGEGGIRAPQLDYLRALRKICDEAGLLLVFDEIQCGMGRTGTLFAYEQAGIAPDIMMLAKGLGGGFPIGALLATEEVSSSFGPGNHGTTFGGNPLAMACGNAVMDVMLEAGFLEQVQTVSHTLRGQLDTLIQEHPDVYAEVRGMGLLLGLRCAVPNTDVIAALRQKGLLAVGAGDNVVRLLPPLIITDAEIEKAIGILNSVAEDFRQAAE